MYYLTVSTILRLIAAVALIVALTKQPYDYFTLLRFIVCFVSAYLIYTAIVTKNFVWTIVFLFLIVLFNPIKTFPIKRETWAIIDVVAAIIMLGSIFLLREDIRPPESAESD